jgi:multiple antibiotic resistance protein
MLDWAELLKIFIGLLVMIDPIGLAPLFLALTSAAPESRAKAARIGVLTATTVLLLSALIGPYVLAMFGITLASFRVVGGILFMLLALDMLNARPSRTKRTEKEDEEAKVRKELAIVPLGIPLMAGPGAISNVIISFKAQEGWLEKGAVLIVILMACVVTYFFLRLSASIAKSMGATGIAILERLMGLILGAIAVEMMVKGLRELFPVLAGAG